MRAEPIAECADISGFALLGESLFSVAKKVTKNACPCIRPRLCRGSFTPSLLQGSAYKGHPWPFKPFAASLPLNPLRNDSAHPPERGGWCRLMVRASGQKKQILDLPGDSDSYPRQEAEWRCCVGGREAWTPSEERRTGPPRQGRPSVTAPGAAPEGGKSGRRPDPDVGVAFSLVTLGQARATKRSGVTAAGWPEGRA